ncbi:hypothetical protein RvY_11766 [Ramazzottius varieornatus]|uniref:Uncharacterized protein n=1 Tax=Ramazzottius varieornatus TaxID=947166 RepID=A0A1D1VH56_RAMVA|nr:hypothetical protein RvY_11766 [Ramazzottius varieornatus]
MSAMHHNVLRACRGLDRASEEPLIGPRPRCHPSDGVDVASTTGQAMALPLVTDQFI